MSTMTAEEKNRICALHDVDLNNNDIAGLIGIR
jgi:hypothetical protein